MGMQEPRKRVIASHFPGPPEVGTADERRDGWRLARRWGGYPDLEWTFGLFGERIKALGGRFPAYFYEEIGDFDTARLLIQLGNLLVSRREPSYPSVGLGFEYFDSAYRVSDGHLACDDTPYRGRHSVATIDHADAEEIMFPNTWNPPHWGDRGFGYISREYFDRHVVAVQARWAASGGPSLALTRCMDRAETLRLPAEERLAHCWPARNVFWTQKVGIGDRQLTMLNWNVFSMATGGLVEVIELRDEKEVLGRAHLFYEEDHATLRELFVRPERRRQQLGGLLEATAADWARERGSRTIEIWLHEGDARERIIGAPLGFAESLGYEWEDVEMRRPNVRKVARRNI
jgi:GNAT superfamily N-acetyltransferase